MAKTILICGYGTGISHAVAQKFGEEGFAVALVARSADKLKAAASELASAGIKAAAFPADLADPGAVRALVGKVKAELGPVTVIHWNAYAGSAGDLTTASADEFRTAIDVSTTGLIMAVQAALPDLRAQEGAAVLVTGGGFCLYDASVDKMAVTFNAMGIAVGKAAQHKLVGLLAQKLRPDNIYVGEAVVLGMVKGTAFDSGNATIEASSVANQFWTLYTERSQVSVNLS